jgi:long-chain fatty acid transport protein
MGGASTAAPLDASGALYWNPAAITGLCSSELDVGLEFLYPHSHLSSSLSFFSTEPGDEVAPAQGITRVSGSDRSDNGIFLLPTVGLVVTPECSPFVFGLGIFSAGGFSVNYPASNLNPILTPQPPNGFGVGSLYGEAQIYQIVPTVAMRITDNLSVGIAPTLSFARIMLDPAVLGTPDDANGDTFPTYPAATHGRVDVGGGAQAGIFYNASDCWHFGASIKSPQWFEDFKYNTVNEVGRPRTTQFRFDYPLMASVGASYTGLDKWVFAADFRYIDYANARGFEGVGFDPATGALKGIGWDSVYAVAVGTQYQCTCNTSLRAGYTYNTNPIRDERTMYNIASPLILQHTAYLGASYNVTQCFVVSAAYAHAFWNDVEGPFITPQGPVPGTSVKSSVSADTVVLGVTVKF